MQESEKIHFVKILAVEMMEVMAIEPDDSEDNRLRDLGIKVAEKDRIKAKQYRCMVNVNEIESIYESSMEQCSELIMKTGRSIIIQVPYDTLREVLMDLEEIDKIEPEHN